MNGAFAGASSCCGGCIGNGSLSLFIYGEAGALLGNYDMCAGTDEDVVYLDAAPLARVKDGIVYPLEADHLGSPRVMQKPDGSGAGWTWNLLANSVTGSNAFGEQLPTGKQNFNLRFPGQYADGNGLSYNYFRDYEAGTGRYVESDPIGLRGGVNTFGYAMLSPLRFSDALGLAVEMCCRKADLPYPLSETSHCWLRTGKSEAGMGPLRGGVPAQNSQYDLPGDPTGINPHPGEGNTAGAKCRTIPNTNEQCVDDGLKPRPTGPFWPDNNCQTLAYSIINMCYAPSGKKPPTQPDIPLCMACINVFGGGSGLCQIACSVH